MMKYLIIGLGQDGLLTAKALERNNIPFLIITRRSMRISRYLELNPYYKNYVKYIDWLGMHDLIEIYKTFKFTHITNFAANSFVQDSSLNFKQFIDTNSSVVWEILKFLKLEPSIYFFHPLSSEILSSRCEQSLEPRNAYGLAKLIDLHSCRLAADTNSLNVHNSILFNHESKYRSNQFFTKKIINLLCDKTGSNASIYNAKSQRDWGYAAEYVDIILSKENSKGYELTQLGTGTLMSVEQFIDAALHVLNISFDKTEKLGLLSWRTDKTTITEVSRDEKDQNRVLKANIDLVSAGFGKVPQISQQNLVKKLIKDHLG